MLARRLVPPAGRLLASRSCCGRGFAAEAGPSARDSLRFLVVDGYAKTGRQELRDGGACTAGTLYRNMLARNAPAGVEVECDEVHPADEDWEFPSRAELQRYDGVAWTGCSLTVHHTDDERVQRQLELCRRVYDAGVPSFGSCWALQIAVVAAGGVCEENTLGREHGFSRKIALNDSGRAHPMFEGKPAVFDAFTAHNDHITRLSEGAVNLAGNSWSAVQAADVVAPTGARFWAVQYHPEYDLHEMARLTACRIPKLIKNGCFKDETAGRNWVDMLEALHVDPSRRDLAWTLGVDTDVTDQAVREVEPRNWIKYVVVPEKAARSA